MISINKITLEDSAMVEGRPKMSVASSTTGPRHLAAILVADVVGSTAMMEQDEVSTLAAMQKVMMEIAEPAIIKHHGRLVKTTGDGAIVEFGSPVEAVICAFEVQRQLAQRAYTEPVSRKFHSASGLILAILSADLMATCTVMA
jgi:adenylate cyclase